MAQPLVSSGRRATAGCEAQPLYTPCRSVIMVGTDLTGTGGIRAVVQGYIDGGLFERFPCVYVPTHRYGSAWVKARTALRAWAVVAFELVRRAAPLVHVQTASRASFWRKSVVCLMARALRRPYLLHVHGGEFLQFYGRECSRPLQRLVRFIFSHAAVVIALSQDWRTAFLGICPAANVEVLPNAVALPDSSALRPLEPRRTLLFLGDLRRAKGVFDLLRAFAPVAARYPALELLCAGRGDPEPVRRLARELGIMDRVVCPGWLDAERKRDALAGALAFALPSYAEGMPMALLEAMSFGLPAIATRVGGIPHVITHGVNGLLIEPGDVGALTSALERLLETPALREALGNAARRTIEARFSLEGTLERLAQIYRRFGLEPRAPASRAGTPP